MEIELKFVSELLLNIYQTAMNDNRKLKGN